MTAFSLRVEGGESTTKTLRFTGRITCPEAQELWDEIRRETRSLGRGAAAALDLTEVEQADGAAVAILLEARDMLRARGVQTEVIAGDGKVTELLRVYRDDDTRVHGAPPARPPPVLVRLGRRGGAVLREVQRWLGFVGGLAVAFGKLLRRPTAANWRDVPSLMDRVGTGAVPIVLVINFLIGIITAYQFGVALKQFGARTYAPDFVCLAITRELGPLMTAIVVTGRSGAAVAAELAAMSVSDEIDALRALHLDPNRFLVFPRIAALVLTLPLLTVLGDILGMLGGLLVATVSLDMTPTGFFTEARTAVYARDISFGLGKSLIFAVTIGMIACQQGLSASGGAAGVGRRTTSSVVSILFALITIDAAFAPRS